MATDRHTAALDKLAEMDDHWLLKEPPEAPEDGKLPEATSETGVAPTEAAVKAARAFIDEGAFYPTPVGGVQWEAQAGAWDIVITFNPEGGATVIYS